MKECLKLPNLTALQQPPESSFQSFQSSAFGSSPTSLHFLLNAKQPSFLGKTLGVVRHHKAFKAGAQPAFVQYYPRELDCRKLLFSSF